MLRDFFTQDIFVGLVLVCLILVVSVSQLFNTRFNDFLSVIWNNRYLKIYLRERQKTDLFNGFLFLNFVLSIGIFAFITYRNFHAVNHRKIQVLTILFVVIAATLLFKLLLEQIVAYFFEFSEIAKAYLFHKSTYFNISGILLIVVNILLLFSALDKPKIIFTTIVLIILINLSGFVRFFKTYQKVLISNFFYFILYLCALEIGPYVILYKVFNDNFG